MNPVSNLIAFTLIVLGTSELFRFNGVSALVLYCAAIWVALSPSNRRPPTFRI